MRTEDIPLIAGHPALDFVNSVEGRGTGTLFNYLADYRALADWCRRVGLLDQTGHAAALCQATRHPIIAKRAWDEAMTLRDGLNRILRALCNGEVPPDPALAAFNATLQQALAKRRLLPSPSASLEWGWSKPGTPVKVPLWEIALAAADLMTGDGHERIKICANGPCDWMFLDTSRNGRRRWCRMSVCGNSSKVRRFRERRRISLKS